MPDTITLTTEKSLTDTVIPNVFFDAYLPRANGEFLKVYLYLLRWLHVPGHAISLSTIADTFNMTENDVSRSLKYWESEGLLSLTFNNDQQINGICLLPLKDLQTAAAKNIPNHSETSSKRNYNMTDLYQFKTSEQGEELIFIIQQYLGHPLSPNDLNVIYYFYDDLGFTTDLIEYLFEYCISNDHSDMRYIEKVALNWSSLHIETVAEAQAQTEAHQRSCFAVMKAFGLGSRQPTTGEVQYVQKWTRTYGFSLEIILEACRRTMMTTHNPSFQYADKILSNWHTQNIHTIKGVLAADETHQQQKKKNLTQTKPQNQNYRPAVNNKFHNFNQRQYDYNALEKKLSQKLSSSDNPQS